MLSTYCFTYYSFNAYRALFASRTAYCENIVMSGLPREYTKLGLPLIGAKQNQFTYVAVAKVGSQKNVMRTISNNNCVR